MPIEDICYLIQLYKEDASFSRFLLSNLIGKMKTGKKLDYNLLVQALLASLRHKN